MENILTVRNAMAIYLNHSLFVPDAFENVFEIDGFLVAYNPNKLVIINLAKQTIVVSEEGTVQQVYGYGRYVSLRKNNVVGVYQYNGSLVLPFEFYSVFIYDSHHFRVRKTEDSTSTFYTI